MFNSALFHRQETSVHVYRWRIACCADSSRTATSQRHTSWISEPANDESASCDSRSNDSVQNDCDGRIAAQYDTGASYACQAEQLRRNSYSLSGSPVHGILSTCAVSSDLEKLTRTP
ncbi:hypothetical protein IG631_08651 [Alternaria alternata]|nr:hypothetical protein IG631_08651 [Alternaria alternata]